MLGESTWLGAQRGCGCSAHTQAVFGNKYKSDEYARMVASIKVCCCAAVRGRLESA